MRIGLVFLAVVDTVVGAVQLLLPRTFYDDFPSPEHPWVALLPPYNEHLMRDVGALTLAMAVVLWSAAVSLELHMVRTALVATLVFTVSHFGFHVAHLEHFPTADAIGQTVSLGLLVLLPAVLLVRSGRLGGRLGGQTPRSAATVDSPDGTPNPVHGSQPGPAE